MFEFLTSVVNDVGRYAATCIILLIVGLLMIYADFFPGLGWLLVILFAVPSVLLGASWYKLKNNIIV